MRIQVHIERLILHGLPVESHQRGPVRAAVESELARLITARGLSSGLMSRAQMPSRAGRTFQLKDGGDPVGMGIGIAGAVYGGLSR